MQQFERACLSKSSNDIYWYIYRLKILVEVSVINRANIRTLDFQAQDRQIQL